MGIIPVAKTGLHIYNRYDTLHIVPTVYIRNEVFLKCTRGSIDTLADNVNFLINKYVADSYRWAHEEIDEYQMDCDWTPGTKDNYFYFLKKLKALSKKKLSCTLRLYPYKYPDKMGVPPVDNAMLMCYNLVNPLENHSKNSILDINELRLYLTAKKYPVKLNVALPAYSWMQVYQNNKFVKVIYTDTKQVKRILKPEKPLWYTVTKDSVINQFYLRAGDRIKVEEVTANDIDRAIYEIKRGVALDKNITVSLFHLDEQQLSRYTNEELSGFYSAFTK